MRSEICKDKTYTDKEGENPQTISDLQHELSEWADAQEEEEDYRVEEDTQGDHQARQEDHRVDRQEEIITEIGMTSKETMRAVI